MYWLRIALAIAAYSLHDGNNAEKHTSCLAEAVADLPNRRQQVLQAYAFTKCYLPPESSH